MSLVTSRPILVMVKLIHWLKTVNIKLMKKIFTVYESNHIVVHIIIKC